MGTSEEEVAGTEKARANLYARMQAAANACLLLQALSPGDSLAIAVYGYQRLASMQPPPGEKLKPMIEAMREASCFVVENLDGTRYARAVHDPDANQQPDDTNDSEASEDGAWAEGFLRALFQYGLMAPGSVAVTLEFILHHVARGAELNVNDYHGDNILGIAPLKSSEDERGFAAAMLANYRSAMDQLCPGFATAELSDAAAGAP